jgi:adenine C2-methylase RlmN of 23S rRNA A2503 and tRNA A37
MVAEVTVVLSISNRELKEDAACGQLVPRHSAHLK